MLGHLTTLAVFILGTILGTLSSALIFEGTVGACLTSFMFLPIVMIMGPPNAAAHLDFPFGLLIGMGAILSIVSFIATFCTPSRIPLVLLMLGAFLWSLGNVFALNIMMSV